MAQREIAFSGGADTEPAVSIVVPVRNESANIEPLIGEIRAALENAEPFEIVYVDDGSADDTLERRANRVSRIGDSLVE